MKKRQVSKPYRDEITCQFIFIHGINGQITRGTDWSGERKQNENENTTHTSKSKTNKARKNN
jgi:hypothetical protein